jgi:tight adherence protein B
VLSSFIPEDERIVTIEDAAELQLQPEHVVRWRPARPTSRARASHHPRPRQERLRMRPDRIVVGECRGGEALDMLQAMNTGHDGSLTTVHANSPARRDLAPRDHGAHGRHRPAGARHPRADRRGHRRHRPAGQLAAAFFLVTANVLFSIPMWYAGLVLIAIVPLVYIENLRRKRVEAIEEQLDNFMLALANALKTTPSIGAALNNVASVITDPMRQELDLALKEMKVGSTLDQALLHMASRVGSRQLDSALSSVLIGRQVGGNLPRVLESTANTLREMRRLEGVVRTKTAEGKMQLWVIALMPFGLLVGLNQLWPGYFDPLTKTFMGYIISTLCVIAWAAAIVLARKVLAVDI